MQSKVIGIILAILGFGLLMVFEYTALILPLASSPEIVLTQASTVEEVGQFMNLEFAKMPTWVR